MLVEGPESALRGFTYDRPEPVGMEAFWRATIEESRSRAAAPRVAPARTGLTAFDVSDVTFSGFGGDDVRAWWIVPREPRGVVVECLGYGGGRGQPHERLVWAAHGFAQLVVDTRGQGGVWNSGDTPDPHGTSPSSPGMLTRGIDDPAHLYYRRLLTDAALAVDAAAQLSDLPIGVVGHSQGGAMALAAAALNERVRAVAARTPFLCAIARSVTVTDAEPYAELGRYLAANPQRAEEVLAVLDHVDIAHLARRIRVPAWISVGLMDALCPPSGVFAAANAIGPGAHLEVRPYNGHEAGGPHDDAAIAAFLTSHLTGDPDAR